jgi:hypothetical protein
VNLRGYCPDFDWYRDECRVTHTANISQEDITLSAKRYPHPGEIGRLIEVFDHTDYPVLIHCAAGADRTGLASAIAQGRSVNPGPVPTPCTSPPQRHFAVLSMCHLPMR